jgi:hypothetical protein
LALYRKNDASRVYWLCQYANYPYFGMDFTTGVISALKDIFRPFYSFSLFGHEPLVLVVLGVRAANEQAVCLWVESPAL